MIQLSNITKDTRMTKTDIPRGKKAKQEILSAEHQKPQERQPDPSFSYLETEASRKSLEDILSNLAKIYGERYEDSWIKRWYRIIGLPLCLILGAVPLSFLLTSLYFGWPTDLASLANISQDFLPVLASFSFLAFISITIAVLFSVRAGRPKDEFGIIKALARRLSGDQSDQE